ncbi:MAG: NrfD/PsrC family molybdoenzyme membrane anchor subunit, partial [Pseudomonadota bacterium]
AALAFLFVAPLPLVLHLGHPERSFEMFLTPNLHSAMAVFGFVYMWYLMVVLILEIWFDYRKDMILTANEGTGFKRLFYRILSLGSTDLSEESIRFDEKAGTAITIIGIPSAFLLHGYVGFIFGSIKANPWWSSVLTPIVFLFSAIVSGLALMLVLYVITSLVRRKGIDDLCLKRLAEFLFYAIIIDLSLESLDFIHRLYESEESIKILSVLISTRLSVSLIVVQFLLGTLIPMGLLAFALFSNWPNELRRLVCFCAAILTLIGIFSTRWNVVIGGQLFSKSLRGLTVYKMELFGLEGILISIGLLILPLIILYVLAKILPPWADASEVTD